MAYDGCDDNVRKKKNGYMVSSMFAIHVDIQIFRLMDNIGYI
jgi:hypothetical protein